jgi:hypothetical protein
MPLTREELIKAFGEAAIEKMRPVVRLLTLRAGVVAAALAWFHSGDTKPVTRADHILYAACKLLLEEEAQNPPPEPVAAEMKVG